MIEIHNATKTRIKETSAHFILRLYSNSGTRTFKARIGEGSLRNSLITTRQRKKEYDPKPTKLPRCKGTARGKCGFPLRTAQEKKSEHCLSCAQEYQTPTILPDGDLG